MWPAEGRGRKGLGRGLAASALPLLRHPGVFRLSTAATRAHEELHAVDHRGVQVRIESAVRVHLRVTDVVSVGGGLAADRAGAWHRSQVSFGNVIRPTLARCYSRAHRYAIRRRGFAAGARGVDGTPRGARG